MSEWRRKGRTSTVSRDDVLVQMPYNRWLDASRKASGLGLLRFTAGSL